MDHQNKMRKERIFYHKGKPRNKYRIPRKLKKERKKQRLKYYKRQEKLLMPIYGIFWFEHVILGG